MASDAVVVRAQPRTWLIVLSALNLLFLVLASLALGFFGLMSYTDSYSHDADRWWGLVGMSVSPVLFFSGLAAIAFLIVRKQPAWSASAVLLVLSLVGLGLLIVAGFGMLEGAKRRGGDWAGIAVLGSMIVGIVCPALTGLLALGAGLCLWAMRGYGQGSDGAENANAHRASEG
jgi:hypothetical protein